MEGDWILVIRDRFVSESFNDPVVRALPPDDSKIMARRAMKEARGMHEVDAAMKKRGLVAMVERARGYTPFSKVLARPKTVTIIPYSSSDPKAKFVGGVGISDGEPASGIIVELDGSKVVRFTSLDFFSGKLVERDLSASDLESSGAAEMVEKAKREKIEPDLPIGTATSLASNAFKALLFDSYSTTVHSEKELREMFHAAPLVNAIAELQHMRHLGLATADSCCCCCSCCWGSCSSCSAVSSANVNLDYYALRV